MSISGKLLSKLRFGKTIKHYMRKVLLCKKYAKPYSIRGKNNKIFLLNNQEKVELENIRYPNLFIKIRGNNNEIIINKRELDDNSLIVNLCILGNNNKCFFSERDRGAWNITQYGDNNFMSVGENTACGNFDISLHSNIFIIGRDCMISSQEELWTDGHSVIENDTGKLLNYPIEPVIIGNHVWLGRKCTLTKGAQIPDNCIVGICSVITKKFTEPNCVIAGAPAKICKRNINWDGRRPIDYFNQTNTK